MAKDSSRKLIYRIFTGPIRLYQIAISPLFGQHCRYYPSCSEYARQAILSFGILKGLWLALKRISRCHPWRPGGYDPIPKNTFKR